MFSTEFWRTVALVFVAFGQTMFVLLYMTFPWWRSFLGRALFYKATMLAVLIDLGLFARTNPTLTDWDRIFIVLYFMLGIGMWFQFFAFLRVMLTSKRADWERDKVNADSRDEASSHREGVLDERDEASKSREGALDDREVSMNHREFSQGNREVSQDSRESSQDSRESSQDSRESEWGSRE